MITYSISNIFFKTYFNVGFFHIIGSYIHGTKGFANQIFINHRIGSFLASNKRNVFEQIENWELKNLFLTMGNIVPDLYKISHFKPIDILSLPLSHQTLLLREGFDVSNCFLKRSDLLTINNTSSYI
jgi:hypothetical protein